MINVRKTRGFKLTALLLAVLFIFQADCLLAIGSRDIEEHEKEYRLAKKECEQRKFKEAKIRLERLLEELDEKEEKQLVKEVKEFLKRIETQLEHQHNSQNVSEEKDNIIAKDGRQKKKKKKFPVLLAAVGVVAAGVLVYSLTRKSKGKRTANIEISFSPNIVYQSNDEKWHYTIFLRETNGVGATLTRIDSNNWKGGSFEDVFGTTHISPYGMLTAELYSDGYTSETVVTYHIWGNDDNGHTNLRWSGSLTLRFPTSNQSSKEMISKPIDTHSH